MLALIETHPGITGSELKTSLGYTGKAGSRKFQKVKGDLEQWLCVWGEDQEESEEQRHTHDQQWHPWATGKIAAEGSKMRLIDALDQLTRDLDAPPEAVLPAAKLLDT